MLIRPLDDRTLYCRICVHSFGALMKAVRLFTASLESHKMPYQTHSIDILSTSNRLAAIRKGNFSTTQLRGIGDMLGQGWAHSIARPCVPISSLLRWSISNRFWVIYMALNTFPRARLSVRSRAHPFDPDATPNTALEATASPSGKNRNCTNCQSVHTLQS